MAKEQKPFEWDKCKVVDEFMRSEKGDLIRVSRTELKEKEYVDVRTFYLNKVEELCPGKGISIPVNDDMPVNVIAAMVLSYKDPSAVLTQVAEIVAKKLAKKKKGKKVS